MINYFYFFLLKMNIPAIYTTTPISHPDDEDFDQKVDEYMKPFVEVGSDNKGNKYYDISFTVSENDVFPLPLHWFLYWLNNFRIRKLWLSVKLNIRIDAEIEYEGEIYNGKNVYIGIRGTHYVRFIPHATTKYNLGVKRSLKY